MGQDAIDGKASGETAKPMKVRSKRSVEAYFSRHNVRDVLRDLTQEVALQQPVDPIQFLHSKIGELMGLAPSSSQAAAVVREQGVSSCRVMVECVGPTGESCQQHLVRRSAVGSDKVLSEWRGEAEALVRRAFAECTDAHGNGNGHANGKPKAGAAEAMESATVAREGTESELSVMRKELGVYKEKLELAVARANRLESSLREAEYKTSQMVARSQMKQSLSSQRRASLPMDTSMITVDGSIGATSRLESGATEVYAHSLSRAASQMQMRRGSLGGTGEGLVGVDEMLGQTMSSRQPRQTVRIGALRSMPSVVTWWQQPVQRWGVLVMMRHGGTKYNEEGRLTGWIDPDLSEEGASTSKESGMQLKGGTKFDLVITSTLKRSVKTAMHVLEGKDAQHVPIIKDWRLNARHWGALQGKTLQEAADEFGKEMIRSVRKMRSLAPPEGKPSEWDERYFGIGKADMPRGESTDQVSARVGQVWEELVVPLLKSSKNVLIVAHGDTVKIIQGFVDGGFDSEHRGTLAPTHPARMQMQLHGIFR